jgi:phosphoribosylformylglycinamidine synthase
MSVVRALVLTGFGLNCDRETAYALAAVGANAERMHLGELIERREILREFRIWVVGGGFSWGDDHGAGVIMAMRLRHQLRDELLGFVQDEGIVIGICNGFQVLVNVGLLPGFEPGILARQVALIGNDCGSFRDQWVHLVVDTESPCVCTRGLTAIELPVRHGEGKFYAEPEVLSRLQRNHQVVMRYAGSAGNPARGEFPDNPNGSVDDIAGICDATGRVFGLMPHPEAYNHFTNHPDWSWLREQRRRAGMPCPDQGMGLEIFRYAVDYFQD